jgi:hypothetical protein
MQEEQYIQIDEDGNKFCYKDKAMTELHRSDGPAIERADGSKFWYADGKLHRSDGPAVEYVSGSKSWYVDGKLHRFDGPAIEGFNGHKFWYADDKLHRTDGPAVEYVSGTKAAEYASGTKFWWINGKILTEETFDALTKPTELTLEDIAAKFGVDVNQIKIVK